MNKLQKKEIRALLLLLLTAAIWGCAFAAQRTAADAVEPFTFGAARFFLGAAALYPVCRRHEKKEKIRKVTNRDILSGVVVGIVLVLASTLQQKGIGLTGAGQAGFLSALYVVLVPVIGAFLGRKTGRRTWAALALSVPALYLLCMKSEGFRLSSGDAWVLASAVFWALHILLTDRFVRDTDALRLCVIQFLTCGIVCLVCALIWENPSWGALKQAIFPILYVGILSTAVAYTTQALGQKDAPPAHAAIVMSMESVFSVVAGAVFLGERMSLAAYMGCALMLAAVILSQTGQQEGSHV